MPTNVSGRVTFILAVLWIALSAIFPSVPPSIFWFLRPNQPISFVPNLKPGIDMVGGTSLTYEIKAPEGGFQGNLAEQVMEALKKRVDPDGVRNLIWRPQGATRLEIQMPLTADSAQAKVRRDQFAAVQAQLEKTNISPGEVSYVVQQTKGDERAAKLKELAAGSAARQKIFDQMAAAWDQIQTAQGKKDAAEQARLQLQYDNLNDALLDTNLPVADLQRILDLPKPEARDQSLAELHQKFADFPARLTAMDAFIKEYADYSKVKDTIDDAAELKQMLHGSGVIEFHILARADELPQAEYQDMVDRLQKRGPRASATDSLRWYEVDRDQEVADQVESEVELLQHAGNDTEKRNIIRGYANASTSTDRVEALMEQLNAYINEPAKRKQIEKEIEDLQLQVGTTAEYNGKKYVLCWTTPDKSLTKREGQPAWALEKATATSASNGSREVAFLFDAEGGILFGDLTSNNINKPLAIVLDDKLISAPNINSKITTSGVITGGGPGGFSTAELNYMVNTLNAGALPAQLTDEPITEEQVGPQLGADNLRAGLMASIIGLAVVGVFLVIYYHISGIIALIALVMNMILILGVMACLNATWTLPAVAGIVLTIGMSVDANVLVFERLREEQERGLSLRMALRNAYDRAASAIIDSNAITAITCVILYLVGSEEVKGFGLTLLIGLVSSLFTALFVTKTIFAVMLNKFNLQKLGSLPLTVPALGKLLHPNIDWMGKAKYFIALSALIIGLGTVALIVTFKKGELFDIEFVSGTAAQFELKQPTPISDVREILSKASDAELPSPNVVSVGTDQKKYEVVTASNDSKTVQAVVLKLLGDRLNLPQASTFDYSGENFNDAMNKAVFPITAETKEIEGFAPPQLHSHLGGVAIVMKNITPKLTLEEIQNRIKQQTFQPQADASKTQTYRQFDVQLSEDGKSAIVLTSDPALPYDALDPLKLDEWTHDLATPMWTTIVQAIDHPPSLQKVSNVDASIAGEMQRDALIALTLSVIVIMGYIWIRFGNVKYGTATVVAMLHDTLLVIGAIGLSHFIGKTGFGLHWLLIEPFRVNLTLVAAVLTVMSYSMVDTIVVFDRIRENRGKFGHLDLQIIDDSINQTLSRTLLTAGTTLMTLFVMYLFGGPGIHGFTFVMLIGILVGTYSSIAIAAPILLIGEKEAALAAKKTGAAAANKQLQGA